jgi:hypothetical protein
MIHLDFVDLLPQALEERLQFFRRNALRPSANNLLNL